MQEAIFHFNFDDESFEINSQNDFLDNPYFFLDQNYNFDYYLDICFDHSNSMNIPNLFNIISHSSINPNSNEVNNNNNKTQKGIIPNEEEIIIKKEIKTQKNIKPKDNGIFLLKKKRKKHDKLARDNIKRKIQVHYLRFLVKFVNKIISEILKKYNKDIYKDIIIKNFQNFQFINICYDFSKKIDSKSFHLLKNKRLKDIFIENSSTKYKYDKNIDIYNNIININKNINNILNKYYLDFFDVFYNKEDSVNLVKYGYDLIISLKGIEKYLDFLENLKKSMDESKFIVYKNRIEECVQDEFKNKSQKFLVEKKPKM